MNLLRINNSVLADVYVDASLSYNKPVKDVETFRVPGRSGALIVDNGTWDNLIITYPCYCKSRSAFDYICKFLGSFTGYQRIYCSVADADHYRMGVPIVPQAPDVHFLNQHFYFDVSFNCKPQRFLVTGDNATILTSSGTLSNPTFYPSRPLLKVTGNGVLTVAGTQITITGTSGATTIYCDAMECYNGATSRNQNVSFSTNDFPTLPAGNVPVQLGTGITRVEITPRWWEI